MKKMLIFGLYGLLILGASAGGTWFLRQRDRAAQEAQTTDPDTPTADLSTHVDVTKPLPPTAQEELPVAVRPGEMSVEEIVRYGLGLKAREAAIQKREEALRRTETQYRLVLADIESEQQEMEGLVVQARSQKEASEQILSMAQKERLQSEQLIKDLGEERKKLTRELEDKKKQMELELQRATKTSPGAQDADTQVNTEANLKELVSVIAGLSPENAGEALREFANDGKIDTAVEILAKLEERKASSILDSMDDKKLVSELLAKFMEMQSPKRL